jgi:hypothetical protein
MAVRYSKQTQKTGASIGTVISVPKPSTWTNSSNLATESSNWNIETLYPGWLECDGRLLNVSDYRALYQVLGNTYGGTQNSTFRLPDYRSKKLMGTGVLDGNIGAGLSLTPVTNPTGTPGGSIDTPGTQGGLYNVSTVRQLPPGSEITPGSPGNPVSIGGSSEDTFELGSFFTTGFDKTTTEVEPNYSGTASFSAGSSNGTEPRLVSAAPVHDHVMRHVLRSDDQASSGSPYYSDARVGFVNKTNGTPLTFSRSGSPLRAHSHYITWGTAAPVSSYGHDEGPGGALYNGNLNPANQTAHDTFVANPSNNLGTTINKTINLVNDAGVNLNPGNIVMKTSSRSEFDAALSVRLQAAEEILLMSPYFRLKYIIKAY